MTEPWERVAGQRATIERLQRATGSLVHAYILVGPSGSGLGDLARGFAAQVFENDAREAGLDPEPLVRSALEGQHPDLVEVGAEGAALRVEEAERLRDAAVRSPVEGRHKVLVGQGFDLIAPAAAALLLKTVEEPPPGSVFVLIAEDVPPELVTIASRCLRVDVPPLSIDDVRERLLSEQAAGDLPASVDRARIDAAAEASGGDLDRARLLAVDERLTVRRDAWLAVPGRLDGTGHSAFACAADLVSMLDEVVEPLKVRQAAEVDAAEEQAEAYGGTSRGIRKAFEERHKRQVRKVRADELAYGLALLASHYRDAMVTSPDPTTQVAALDRISDVAVGFAHHNPNEKLQLQALFAELGRT